MAKGVIWSARKHSRSLSRLIEQPRRIIIMVKAGAPVDGVLNDLTPLLDPDDIVIDGGNSLFTDTERRSIETAGSFRFMGMGISGGEEGALNGPSLMPGGPDDAYKLIEPMLIDISAKSASGACVTHIGTGGSGHYVKMVHNGIEYGDMQLIAEVYDLMSRVLGMTAPEIGDVFAEWNRGRLESYLVEITAQVLAVSDIKTGSAARRHDPRHRRAKGNRALDEPERARSRQHRSRPSTPLSARG